MPQHDGQEQRLNLMNYLHRLVRDFGLNTVIVIISTYAGLKGLTYQLVSNVSLPYFKRLNFTGDQYQMYNIVTSLPWSMKSTIGLMSDCVVLLGYHKRSYIILFSILGSLSLFALAFVTNAPVWLSTSLFALVNLQVAAVDLLTEGKYAQLMVSKPETGSDIVTFVQGMYAIGGIFGSLLTAPLITFAPLALAFLLCGLISFQVIFIAFRFFPEDKEEPTNVLRVDTDKLRTHGRLVNLSIFITLMSVVLAAATFILPPQEPLISMIISLILIMLSTKWLSFSVTLRNVNLYLFLNNAMYVPISGALSYFFTADESCVPGGPNFSTSFYVSVANALTQFAYLLGAVLFQICFSRGSFRSVIIITNLVKACSSLADIVLVSRMNRRLNISDRVLFIFGDAVFYHVAYRFELVPLIVLTSKVCPPGLEASVYAILVSFQNLGGSLGQSIGFALMKLLHIQTVSPCDFSNLPTLVIVARFVLPMLSIPLVFWLIPNAQLTDDIIESAADNGWPHRSQALISERAQSVSPNTSDSTPDETTPLR